MNPRRRRPRGRSPYSDCPGCGLRLLWVRTRASGAQMPLVAENDEAGTVLLDDVGRAIVYTRREALDADQLMHGWDGPYATHFREECPG